jgi:hypothetical protein
MVCVCVCRHQKIDWDAHQQPYEPTMFNNHVAYWMHGEKEAPPSLHPGGSHIPQGRPPRNTGPTPALSPRIREVEVELWDTAGQEAGDEPPVTPPALTPRPSGGL